MALIQCPDCKCEVDDEKNVCEKCELNESKLPKEQPQIKREVVKVQSSDVHKPRCPYCNSENLTRITSFDKALNIAMFGLLGNKRKYQWHCNNCKTNW